MKKTKLTIRMINLFLLLSLFSFVLHEGVGATSTTKHQYTITETNCINNTLLHHDVTRLNITGLGDSLTAGTGDETATGGYIGILEQSFKENDCPITIKNFAKKGLNSNDLVELFTDDEISKAVESAHIIIVTIGANDLIEVLRKEHVHLNEAALKNAEKQYNTNIKRILTEIRTLNHHAQIYLLGLYNPLTTVFIDEKQLDLLITKWNNISKKQIDDTDHAYFVPLDDAFPEEIHSYLAKDHFHPNYSGYKLIAERLMSILGNEGE